MMNLFDRAVAAVDPARGRDRAIARAQLEAIDRASGMMASGRPTGGGDAPETKWRGASRLMRTMSKWLPRMGSAYTDTPPNERDRMVSRSHDAWRNHMVAGAAVVRVRTNVVGTGLVPHSTVNARALGLTDDEADALNVALDEAWASWAEDPAQCDVEGTLDFYQLQALALISALLSGDAWALTPALPRYRGAWELKVQLIDSGRVSNPDAIMDTPTLQQGVELDASGFPLAVHIARFHPGETLFHAESLAWDRREIWGASTGRRRVMQVWQDKDRIGQVRGVPMLAPILEPLQVLETYSRAELTAAVVSSLFTVFLERGEEALDSDLNPLAGIVGEETIDEAARDSAATESIELAAGSVMELPEGFKISQANPARPNAQYDPFFRAVLSQIGARLELPLDVLLLSYNTSYSAARAAMLEAYRMFGMRRWWLVQQFCAPVRALWLDEVVARGVLRLPGYADPVRRAAYALCMWVGPARGSMDELKEAQAARARIDGGLSNETIETAAMLGESWQRVHNTRVRERRIMRRDSIKNDPAVAPAANGGNA